MLFIIMKEGRIKTLNYLRFLCNQCINSLISGGGDYSNFYNKTFK